MTHPQESSWNFDSIPPPTAPSYDYDVPTFDFNPPSEIHPPPPSSPPPSSPSPSLSRQSIIPCSECQKPAKFMCSTCGPMGPRYCSQECQLNGWVNGHDKTCMRNMQNGGVPNPSPSPVDERRRESAEARSPSIRRRTMGRSSMSRWNAAQLINRNRASISGPSSSTQENTSSAAPTSGAFTRDQADEFKFYMHQVYAILQPVVICIILSIFWVKVSNSSQSDYAPVSAYNFYSISESSSSSSSSSTLLSSLTSAALIIGEIIVATIIIVALFIGGCFKILIGFFMLVVIILLGFMSYLLMLNLVQVFSIPLDYFTMFFALYNFTIVGLISVFWKGPLWLQQSYLTIMSSLMAFSLTGLEQWTTWILLGLLAIWDLIAVLCPFGPLKILVESSRKQQREIPALLYSVTAVFFMATPPSSISRATSPLPSAPAFPTTPTSQFFNDFSSAPPLQTSSTEDIPLEERFSRQSEPPPFDSNGVTAQNIGTGSGQVHLRDGQAGGSGFARLGSLADTEIGENDLRNLRTAGEANNDVDDDDEDEDETERNGLKLGLGDFVFYSVLIARAALYDWITTICCTIAVLTGMATTIFLLVIYKKALPALPISIALGILFYFVAKMTLVPLVDILDYSMVGI